MKKLALTIALGALFVPSIAAAQQHTAVLLNFKGWKAKRARVSVLSGIANHVEVAPRSLLRQTASDLGHDPDTQDGIVAACESIGATVVVKGRVRGRGKRAKTIIKVLDGQLRELESGTAPSPKTRRGRKKIQAVASKLMLRAVAKLPDPEDDFDEPEPRSRRVVVAASDVDEELGLDPEIDEPSGSGLPIVDVEDEDEEVLDEAIGDDEPIAEIEEEEEEEEEEEVEAPAKATTKISPKRRSRPALITALSGFTFRSRSARIGLTNDRNARHRSGVFPELAVSLKLTPFKPRSTLGPAFIQLEGRYGFQVKSLERTSEVSTGIYRFAADVGYTTDVAFLRVGGAVGVGHDAVTLGDNGVMGAARYTYVRLGGLATWEVSEDFVLRADIGLRPILSAGELGSLYGQGAGAFGFDMGAGFRAKTDIGFSYGFGVGLSTYALLFSEPGELSPPVTATGGSDTSILVDTFIGWAF